MVLTTLAGSDNLRVLRSDRERFSFTAPFRDPQGLCHRPLAAGIIARTGLSNRSNDLCRRGFVFWARWSLAFFNSGLYECTSSGYYYLRHDRHMRSLHRDVWIKNNGPIPTGFHIHHVDENASNNRLDNLKCLSASEHSRTPHRHRLWARKHPGHQLLIDHSLPTTPFAAIDPLGVIMPGVIDSQMGLWKVFASITQGDHRYQWGEYCADYYCPSLPKKMITERIHAS